MTDGIRFQETLACNSQENRTIEDNTKLLFAYGGIHDRSFDSEINDAFATLDATVWNVGGASLYATWSIASSQLQGVGGGDADWDLLLSVDDMPADGKITVTKNCARGGLIFRATDKDNGFMFFWDADSCGFQHCDAGSWSILIDLPKIYSGIGDVTLSWREMKFRAVSDEKYLFMAAWIDGELACTTEYDISDAAPGKKVGFAVYDSDTVLFDDCHLPELAEIIEWCSVDVGESPGGALSRMLGRRHIKYFLRYDATLRMWRPKDATSTYTYQRHITNFNWDVDHRNLVGHWRQVGAWEQADYLDTAVLAKGVARFHKDNNPDLTAKEACYNEAVYAIQRLNEISDRVDMSVPAQVLQEPEDVATVYFERDGTVVLNNVEYIVDLEQALTLEYRNKLTTVLHLRKKQA